MRIELNGFIITQSENEFGGMYYTAVNAERDLVLHARTIAELMNLIKGL